MLLVLHLRDACTLSELALDIVRLAMQALRTSKRRKVIHMTMEVLKGVLNGRNEGDVLRFQARDACDFSPLVALAISGELPKDLTAPAVRMLCFFDENLKRSAGPSVEAILLNSLSRQQNAGSESLAETQREVLKRKKQLEEIFQAQGSSATTQRFVECGSGLISDAEVEKGDTSFQMEPEHPMDPVPSRMIVSTVPEWSARRKCSRADCTEVESKPQEFKLCGGCRLAVYCSQGDFFFHSYFS